MSCANRKFIRESIEDDYSVFTCFKDREDIENTLKFNYFRRGAHSFTFLDSSTLKPYLSIKFLNLDTVIYSENKSFVISNNSDSLNFILEKFGNELTLAKRSSKLFEECNWYYSNHNCINRGSGKTNSKDIEVNISGLHFNSEGKNSTNSCRKDILIDSFWYYTISNKWNKAERKYFIKTAKKKFKVTDG